MMKKYKHIKEADEFDFTDEEMAIIDSEDDMPDGYFDVGTEDDIWADDYYGIDDDIEKTDLAESPDDVDDDFFEIDDDDEIDVEDPAYWEDAQEIDPNTIEIEDDDELDENDFAEPIHHDDEEDPATGIPRRADFERIMSLKDMPESKVDSKRRVVESRDSYEIAEELNNDPAIQSRLGTGPFHKASEITPEMVDEAVEELGTADPLRLHNYFKAMLESKQPSGKRMKEDMALFCNNKPKDENREIPEWVMKAFHESKGSPARFKKICESYLNK